MASAGTNSRVKLWEFVTGKLLHRLSCFFPHFGALAFSADSRLVAAGAAGFRERGPWDRLDRSEERWLSHLTVWDAQNGRELLYFEAGGFVNTLSFRAKHLETNLGLFELPREARG